MPHLLSRLFDRFWRRPQMAALLDRHPIEALRRDHVRAERISALARAAVEPDLDADDARVARALYALAIDEAGHTRRQPGPATLPTVDSFERAATAAERQDLLAQCDAAYEQARRGLLEVLEPHGALLRRRFFHTAAAVLLLTGSAAEVKHLVHPELAGGRPWRASSTSQGLPQSGRSFMSSGLPRAPDVPRALVVHTNEEDSPWLEIDLESPRTVHSAEVDNRSDCCGERAVPLVLELSTDGRTWATVARREEPFTTWSVSFSPHTARWFRLRVDAPSLLHIEGVKLW